MPAAFSKRIPSAQRAATSEQNEDSSRQINIARKALLLALVANACAHSFFLISFPALARELGLSDLQAGLLMGLSALAMTLSSPVWGVICERKGRRPVFLAGLLLITLILPVIILALNLRWQLLISPALCFSTLLILRLLSALGSSGTLIDDQLAAGLAIRTEKGEEGFYNRLNNSDKGGKTERYTLSASADWWLSDDTEVRFRSTLEKNDSGMARMRFVSGNGKTPEHTTNYNTDAQQQKQSQVHSVTVEQTWDTVTLTAITGVTHFERDFVMDLDAGPMPAPASELDLTHRMVSQEIRLSSDLSAPDAAASANKPRWLAGLYLFDENSDIQFTSGVPSRLRDTRIDQQGIALFANVDYPVNERLTLSAGSRIEYLDQQGRQTLHSLQSPSLSQSQQPSHYQDSAQHSEFLPRLGLNYQLSPQSFLYASLARGYLPGGYNYNLAGNADSFIYQAEYSDTAEAGLKTQLTPATEVQLAAFYTRSTDKQILDLQPGGIQKISNAAKAQIYGLELSLQSTLSDRWQLFSSLGLQHSEATDYTQTQFINGNAIRQDLSGNELPMAAPYNWQTGLNYNAEGASGSHSPTQGVFGSISLQGSGDFWFDSQNRIKQSAYQTLDLEVGYQWPAIRASVAARNLLDQHYYTRAVNTPGGLLVEDAAAREISLNLSARW